MAKHFTPVKLSENISETPEGFLLCKDVPMARTGEMVYGEGETPLETDDDGKIIIERDAKEVFHPDTMASFEGKAVTIKHPEDFVSPDNWSYLAKGIVQNVRRGEGKDEDGEESLLADLLITDAMAIQLIKAGLREVSCGYEAEYEQLGEGRGRQTKIIGNHLALVEEGRAGQSYAINDHKGKGNTMSQLAEKMKKLFAKAVDEAEGEKKEEKKEESKDAAAYDELVKMVKDLGEKISAMGKPKDEAKPYDKDDKKEDSKDESEEKKEEKPAEDSEKDSDKEEKKEDAKDSDEAPELEERLKALEAAVSKLLDGKSKDADADAEESEEGEDEDKEEKEESEDEQLVMTNDHAARVEILAPGIKPEKDYKVKSLKAAYDTKDGKDVIHALTGGKKPAYDSAEKMDTLFIAASEVLKSKRGVGLDGTKSGKFTDQSEDLRSNEVSAEKMNELNAAHWDRK